MIRFIQRNSNDATCVEDLAELKNDLSKSGHPPKRLQDIEPNAVAWVINNELSPDSKTQSSSNQLVFSVRYFQEIKELKKLVHSVKEDIHHPLGTHRSHFLWEIPHLSVTRLWEIDDLVTTQSQWLSKMVSVKAVMAKDVSHALFCFHPMRLTLLMGRS